MVATLCICPPPSNSSACSTWFPADFTLLSCSVPGVWLQIGNVVGS